MNPVVIVLALAALVTVVAARPLIRRKVKMNGWYGVRIPAAFASEKAWYDINAYGGRLLRRWGWSIAFIAIAGGLLEERFWELYNWAAVVVIIGGLGWMILAIYRYSRE